MVSSSDRIRCGSRHSTRRRSPPLIARDAWVKERDNPQLRIPLDRTGEEICPQPYRQQWASTKTINCGCSCARREKSGNRTCKRTPCEGIATWATEPSNGSTLIVRGLCQAAPGQNHSGILLRDRPRQQFSLITSAGITIDTKIT